MMKEMDKEGVEQFREIKKWKNAGKKELDTMQRFTQDYIDPKCKICRTCPAQIRFAYNRIINWGNIHNIEAINFDDKVCECGNKITDKRRKSCGECK
tara:strand:+ start:638 stop:928 length:291 start_codon:yes stop_codon:yes gene_type:complete